MHGGQGAVDEVDADEHEYQAMSENVIASCMSAALAKAEISGMRNVYEAIFVASPVPISVK
ncbi:hypothetical protein GCM10025858_22710 [Alicyclobacillus sacchari]|nr:hypothetical protein GCM10025858_22710 [Alicyclobacillus sacchari]